MTKENLEKFKEYLENLTEEEKILRNEYLKNISKGKIFGPPTGYPSVDKPQLKYYKEKPTRKIDSNQTLYDLIFKNNDTNKEAILYLDGLCSWTYGKLKNKTDKCINAFKEVGIKEGDTVLFGVVNTPEIYPAIIALVSLGASAKLFDIRASENDILEYANSSNCNYMITLDKIVLPKVEKIIDKTSFDKVFVLRPGNSLSLVEKIKFISKNPKLDKKIELPEDKRFEEFTSRVNKSKSKKSKRVEFSENRPAIMIQSSGTTGKAKTIVQSEKSIIESIKALSYNDLPLGEGKTVLVALPPWIAYGLVNATFMSLAFGSKVLLSTDFEADAVFRSVGKFTMAYAAPFHYRYVREHYNELTDEQMRKLSLVDALITGGDKYAAEENENDERLFGTVVCNGYGNNENLGAMTVNSVNFNRYGSVGIPKYDETVVIVDPDTYQELPYGQIGEVCTLSKTIFNGYENNVDATNETLKVHSDGKVYLHTGDLGYIDNDGFLFLKGRSRRVIVRQGFKLSAYTIEDAITSLPFVKECIAVEVPDKIEEHVPMAFVVIDEKYGYSKEEAIDLLKESCKSILKENEIPKHFRIEKALKYTDNSKYDFREYERLGKEYVADLEDIVKLEKKI